MRGPLTPDELAAVLDDGDLPFDPGHDFHEYDVELIKEMAREIMMHRDAMAPVVLSAMRLHTDELAALRRRVQELEWHLREALGVSAGIVMRSEVKP